MLELLLIRHGQTAWNAARKVMGRQPIPLSVVGHAQAEALAQDLKGMNVRALVASPIARARETAEILAARLPGVAVENDEAFAELDYGEWVNLTFDELQSRYAAIWREYRRAPAGVAFPGGESVRDAAARIVAGLDGLLRRVGDGRVLLVSHADVLKIALLHALGAELNLMARMGIDNCAPLLVRWTPEDGARLVIFNRRNFLGKEV